MRSIRNAVPALLFVVATAFGADERLVSLLMPDAKMIAGMSMEAGKGRPFARFVLEQLQAEDEKFEKFLGEIGFDAEKDANEVLVASTGDPALVGVILARGSFDIAKIQARAAAAGGKLIDYAGIQILTNGEAGTGGLAFLDNTLAIMGDLTSVHGAIDRRESKESLDAALIAKMNDVSGANDAWFVSILPMAQLAGKMPDPSVNVLMKGSAFGSILEASGGVRFGDNVLISLQALTRSPKDSKALIDIVKFLAAMIQSNLSKNTAAALEKMKIGADENNVVRMSLTLPESVMEQIFQPAKLRAKAPAAPTR